MKTFTGMFAILVVISLLVSGCGASPASSQAGSQPSAPTATAVQARATEPTPGLLAVVRVAQLPTMLAATSNAIWVQSHGNSILTRIDPSQNKEVEKLEDVPAHCEVISGGGFVWASEAYAGGDRGRITKVDPASSAIVGSLQLSAACGIAANDTDLWVVSPRLGQAVRYDAATLEERAVIPLGKEVFEVEVSPEAVWASGETDGGTVWRIDPATNQVVATIAVPSYYGNTGLVAAFGSVWVGSNKGLVYRIDPATNSVAQTITLNNGIGGLGVGRDAIWAAGSIDGTIYRIDPATNAVSGSLSTHYSTLGPPLEAFDSLWVPTGEYDVVLRIDPAVFNGSAATTP